MRTIKISNFRHFLFVLVLTLMTSPESASQTKKEVEKHLTEKYSKNNRPVKVELKNRNGRKIYTERLNQTEIYIYEVRVEGRVVKRDTIKLERGW